MLPIEYDLFDEKIIIRFGVLLALFSFWVPMMASEFNVLFLAIDALNNFRRC